MAIFSFVKPGLPRRTAPGLIGLVASDGGGGSSGGGGSGDGGSGFTGPYVSSISGLSGWWDAGQVSNPVTNTANLLTSSGSPVSAWGAPVGNIADQSGGGRTLALAGGSTSTYNGTGPMGWARRVGSFGGVGGHWTAISAGNIRPFVDPTVTYSVANVRMDAGAAWTRYLVWSRPNLAQVQSTTFSGRTVSGPTPLVQLGTTTIASIGNTGVNDALTVFGTSLPANLAPRHTHSLTLVNTPGTGVDVYLDDAKLNTSPIANTISAATPGTLKVLGSGSGASAQCLFHELATWERALSGADLATLLTASPSCSKRWARGVRQGRSIVLVGQSNADVWAGAGGVINMSNLVAYYLGLLSFNVLFPGGVFSGRGVYYPYDANEWLVYSANGPPSTWALGACGSSFQTLATTQLTADIIADICGFYVHWSENDCQATSMANLATMVGAYEEMVNRSRSFLGKTAAQSPVFFARSLPYGTIMAGVQAHRVGIDQIIADPAQNALMALGQPADGIPRGATYNADGTWVDGSDNGSHTDEADDLTFAKRASVPIAAGLIAQAMSADPGTPASVPAGVPGNGPTIASATYEGTTHAATGTVLVTVQHDAGNDLQLALQALNGIGWAVMDGGSLAAPGAIVAATACARVNATHVRVTLTQTLTNAPAACLLFYPYGSTRIGRGDAVTDNYASLAKPVGWDPGTDFGPGWNLDWPIQATANGVALT